MLYLKEEHSSWENSNSETVSNILPAIFHKLLLPYFTLTAQDGQYSMQSTVIRSTNGSTLAGVSNTIPNLTNNLNL